MRLPTKTVLMLVLATGLTACRPVGSATPPMSDSLFVDVLVQLHMNDAQAFARSMSESHDGTVSLEMLDNGAVQDSVLDTMGIDVPLFHRNLAFYAEHPDDFVARYNEVLERLNAMEL